MITIFAIPKPFKGHVEVIQGNAIRSWMNLDTSPEVILYADEEGVADFAHKNNLKHVPGVTRNEFNTPLLDDIFKKTQEIASNDIICYVNSDIIFLNDFITTVKEVASRKNKFLTVGKRWNVDIKTPSSSVEAGKAN